MECPWYLGLKATEECIENCPVNEQNRNKSICPIDPDDVPLITLEGYAETHEELERMVRNCERELEESRKELGLVR